MKENLTCTSAELSGGGVVMRTPRARPDLRLAENFIPGVIAWIKGIIYTSLCLLVQYGNIEGVGDSAGKLLMLRALPMVMLYYDHLIYHFAANAYVDSTAVATDVLAATIAAQFAHLDYSCTSMWCWFIPLIWALFGACHIYLGDVLIPRGIGHLTTAALVLSMFIFSKGVSHSPITMIHENITIHNNNFNVNNFGIGPYYARAASYLSFVIIDAYTLRSPLQREKDRVGLLRYGSTLFAPIVPLMICVLILLGTQITKIYFEFSNLPSTQQQPLSNQQQLINNNNNSAIGNKQLFPPRTNAVDALEIQEAFRLAKLQYMDGKASV
jgi:hypothetical protein